MRPLPRPGDKFGILTDDVLDQVRVLMAKNPERKRIFRLLGVNGTTFNDWVRKGRALEPGDPHPYRQLAEILDTADLLFERACLDSIFESAQEQTEKIITEGNGTYIEKTITRPGDWKARAWLLEKRFPKKYGDRRHVEVEGTITLEAALTAIAHDKEPKKLSG